MMRVSKFLCAAIVLLVLTVLSAAPLRADGTDTYIYTADGNTFTWQLPVNPNPNSSNPTYDFTFSDFTLKENGHAVAGTLDFYTNLYFGGFDFWTGNSTTTDVLIDAYGPQLFSEPNGLPTMLKGDFSFWDFAGNDNNSCEPPYWGTLQATATPEPSTLLLLFVGLVTALGIAALRKN
jgi:hypothetical protein